MKPILSILFLLLIQASSQGQSFSGYANGRFVGEGGSSVARLANIYDGETILPTGAGPHAYRFDATISNRTATLHAVSITYSATLIWATTPPSPIENSPRLDLTLTTTFSTDAVGLTATRSANIWALPKYHLPTLQLTGAYRDPAHPEQNKDIAAIFTNDLTAPAQNNSLRFDRANQITWGTGTATLPTGAQYHNFLPDAPIKVADRVAITKIRFWEPGFYVAKQTPDLTSDGIVDGADFLEWQRSNQEAYTLALWKQAYESPTAASVPEPTSLSLASIAILLAATAATRVNDRRTLAQVVIQNRVLVPAVR